jgi:hypothetical protein
MSDQRISRQHAEHVALRDRDRMRTGKALAERIERARADVPVYDAEGREGEERDARLCLLTQRGPAACRLSLEPNLDSELAVL